MNRHALSENPLLRRRDSIIRNTERLETADESFTSSNAVSAGAVTADDGTRAADNRVQFVLTPRHLQLLMTSVIKSEELQGTNSIVLRSSGC